MVDCDTLTVPGGDPRITVCSAAPGTATPRQPELLAAIGVRTVTVTLAPGR
ncbi:hypothetical protein [Streptomyces avermitilis]|uniref:hypothetical protein n=1 Tax=Streptomyces avermitilis TaxID=33903 RepID=UPI00368D01FA